MPGQALKIMVPQVAAAPLRPMEPPTLSMQLACRSKVGDNVELQRSGLRQSKENTL